MRRACISLDKSQYKVKITSRLFNKLEKASKTEILFFGIFQILILGIINYATGYEISFAVFYLIPVAMTVWFADRRQALAISILTLLPGSSATRWLGNFICISSFPSGTPRRGSAFS